MGPALDRVDHLAGLEGGPSVEDLAGGRGVIVTLVVFFAGEDFAEGLGGGAGEGGE